MNIIDERHRYHAVLKSTKFQAPTAKQIPNHQIPNNSRCEHAFEIWEIDVSLELGALSGRPSYRRFLR